MASVDLVDLKKHPFFSSLLNYNAHKCLEEFYQDICEHKQMSGNKVMKVLDAMIEKHTFHKRLPANTLLYRARTIMNAEDLHKGISKNADGSFNGFDEANSIEAPFLLPQSARVNIKGMSYLYLAEDPYTACSEVRPHNNSFVSLATFKLLQPASLMDLKTNHRVTAFEDVERELQASIAVMITKLMERFVLPNIDESIYLSTQFISDYFRKAGFDGIRFKSSMSGGVNITLFNSHHSRVQFVHSKVVAVHSQHFNIIDLDNGHQIESPVDYSIKPNYYVESCRELENYINSVNSSK